MNINRITNLEIKNSTETQGRFHILVTYEDGGKTYFDKNIKTERGAKSRLTYHRNRFVNSKWSTLTK